MKRNKIARGFLLLGVLCVVATQNLRTAPTAFDLNRLYVVNLVATIARVLGTLHVGGNFFVHGTTDLDGDLIVSGSETIHKNLVVDGNVTVNGTLTATTSTPADSCAFSAHPLAVQAVDPSTTAVVVFDAININNGSAYTPPSSFTAPATKLYYFHAAVTAMSPSATGLFNDHVSLRVGSNDKATVYHGSAVPNGIFATFNISVILQLNAGEVVTITYTNNDALNFVLIQPVVNTYFEGYQLN